MRPVPVLELDMMIAFVNSVDRLHNVASNIFDKIVRGELGNAAIPCSAYMEYELILKSRGYSEEEVRLDLEAFRSLKNLGEVPLTLNILLTASRLRAMHGLSYFDSLHAASALAYDKVIISVDKAYERIPELKVMDPRKITGPERS